MLIELFISENKTDASATHQKKRITKQWKLKYLPIYLAPPPPRINPMDVPVSLRASREKSEFLLQQNQVEKNDINSNK